MKADFSILLGYISFTVNIETEGYLLSKEVVHILCSKKRGTKGGVNPSFGSCHGKYMLGFVQQDRDLKGME